MNITKKQRKTTPFVLFITLLLMFFSLFGGGTLVAKAETQTITASVEEIVDNTIFVCFRKGNTAERGKYIIANFYVPKEYYYESHTYGVIIFPKDYGIKHGLLGDYFKKSEETGAQILNVVATTPMPEEEGFGINCGLIEILEANASRPFSFIFYVKDTSGNVAYKEPQFADYNSLNAGELTMEEFLQKTEVAKDMQGGFRTIVIKIQELVDSVWVYVVIALSSVVVVWALYIGIRVIISKKNEEKINAKGMLKQLIIGIIIMFVLAAGTPLLINGLSHWVTW